MFNLTEVLFISMNGDVEARNIVMEQLNDLEITLRVGKLTFTELGKQAEHFAQSMNQVAVVADRYSRSLHNFALYNE